jgi:LmbE family N-acetylglucosaminyl deacetylase
MRRYNWFLVVVVLAGVIVLLIHFLGRADVTAPSRLPTASVVLNEHDRVLVLAPHPDDEVLACGGVIQQAVALGLPVRVAFFTYGDFYEHSFIVYKKRPVLTPKGVEGMGEIRHGEAVAADSTLGVSKDNLRFLGYPDFGTLEMWYAAWGDSPPVKGLLSRATVVPYQDAVRPGAPYKGEEVLKDLTLLMREFRPTKVFVSHPADHHPDHKALYVFTRVCLFDLEKELTPQIYPYLVHYTDWPVPKGLHPDKPLMPPGPLNDLVSWRIDPLDSQLVQRKLAALKGHRTQYETTPGFLNSFVRSTELFGDFPVVELDANVPACPMREHTPYDVTGEAEPIGEEHAFLVGIVKRTARIEKENLVMSIELTHPLAREIGFSVYLFGYRDDRPFPEMPKLHAKFGPIGHEVYDRTGAISRDRIGITRSGRHIEVDVPLEMMGNPQRILTGAKTYAGDVPLDWAAWRILRVNDVTAGRE